ncbi:MAG: transposase [Chthoniobacter sp.]|nr:transposase [Chthoniobacter sp.]
MPNRPPRLDLLHQTHAEPLFFVTFNTRARAAILATPAVHQRFITFAREAERRNIAVGRYVIMPDHIHLFVRGGPDFNLASWVRMLRRCLSEAITAPPPHWQEGFFDHLLRHDESYTQKWEYVRQNPVRAALSPTPEQWPHQGEIVLIDRA